MPGLAGMVASAALMASAPMILILADRGPVGAQGNRASGIGVQFAENGEGEAIKNRIETMLAGSLNGEKPTHTM